MSDDDPASGLLRCSVLDLGVPSASDAGIAFEIEAIEDRYYGTAVAHGLSFVAEANGQILAVHLHSDGHEDYSEYSGRLPQGLAFSMSQLTVRAALGPPTKAADGSASRSLRATGPWDLYDDGDRLVHVEYTPDAARILMVTLRRRPKTAHLARS